MKYYRAIYIEPPFDEWGFYRVQTLPIWRIVDTKSCNLVVVTSGKWLKSSLVVLDGWGFAFYQATPYRGQFALYGTYGDPILPEYEKYPPLKALTLLPGPRITMNYSRRRKGWDTWSIYGWPRIDPYSYPIRQNYVEVNHTIASLVYEAREAQREGKQWRFRVGDAINSLTEQGLSKKEAIRFIQEATGLGRQTIDSMSVIASNVPLEQRGTSLSWVELQRKYGMKSKRGIYDGETASSVGDGSRSDSEQAT